MRIAAILLICSLLIAPVVASDEATLQPLHGCSGSGDHDNDGIPNNEDPDCHDHDTPGFGVIALVGALAAVAFLRRRG